MCKFANETYHGVIKDNISFVTDFKQCHPEYADEPSIKLRTIAEKLKQNGWSTEEPKTEAPKEEATGAQYEEKQEERQKKTE